jgi:hypothetical protein
VAHSADLPRHLERFITPAGHLLLTVPNGSYFRTSRMSILKSEIPALSRRDSSSLRANTRYARFALVKMLSSDESLDADLSRHRFRPMTALCSARES